MGKKSRRERSGSKSVEAPETPAKTREEALMEFFTAGVDELRLRGDEERKAADDSATPHLPKGSRAMIRGMNPATQLNGAIVRIDEWDEAKHQHCVFLCQLPSGAVCDVPTELYIDLNNLEPEREEARDDESTYRQAVAAADAILDLLRGCDGTDYSVTSKIMHEKNVLCNFGDVTMAKGLSRLLSHLGFLVQCACEYTCLQGAFDQGRARVTEPKLDGCVVFEVMVEPAEATRARGRQAAAVAAAAAANAEDPGGWPVRRLKEFLATRSVDTLGFSEKGEYVAEVRRVRAKEAATGGGLSVAQAREGEMDATAAEAAREYDHQHRRWFYRCQLLWRVRGAGCHESPRARAKEGGALAAPADAR